MHLDALPALIKTPVLNASPISNLSKVNAPVLKGPTKTVKLANHVPEVASNAPTPIPAIAAI